MYILIHIVLQPLPFFEPVTTTISPELFADAVEVLEFLHHYGPLFNIKEAIHTTVTFRKYMYFIIYM